MFCSMLFWFESLMLPQTGKISVIRHYKFTLAFENSNVEDYISEKFFDALVAGSVPVHLGLTRANAELFAPASNRFDLFPLSLFS